MTPDHPLEYWHTRADTTREMAGKTRDPQIRQHLLDIAASYDRLGEFEEEHYARRDLSKAE